MRIAVVGIGGVGGYYGGLLAKRYSESNDVEITFVARGRHLEEIKANGLKVLGEKASFTVHPDWATDVPSGSGIYDLIFFCVKSYDLEESAKILVPNINKDTILISLLNGVDNAERLRSVLNDGIVLDGCVYISSHIVRPGVVQQAGGSCKLFFGAESNGQIDGSGIERTLREANIDAAYQTNIKHIVWEKYVFISPFASATTYLGKTIREVLADPEGKLLLGDLLEEVLDLAEARGLKFPQDIKAATIEKANAFPLETKTSMQVDFEKGKKTELETFTGYIVHQGKKRGLSVPVHEKVYNALKKRIA